MRNDTQWNDIVGMLKIQGSTLERNVLEHWATTLKMAEVLNLTLTELDFNSPNPSLTALLGSGGKRGPNTVLHLDKLTRRAITSE